MADLYTLIDRMIRERQFNTIARNPLAQFGTDRRPLLGASILPERLVDVNNFTEESVRYRTVIALGSGRYSPSQKRGEGLITGKVDVVLAESDVAREFTSRDYDALVRLINGGQTMDAMLTLLNWTDTVINRALVELLEVWRWQAIISASVTVHGDDELNEVVPYPNPSGHRVAAGGVWSNNAYDPMPDLLSRADKLVEKGYTPTRTVTSRAVVNKLLKNTNMVNRFGGMNVIVAAGVVTTTPSQVRGTLADLNGLMAAEGLPPFEMYDATYNNEATTGRFMPVDSLTMLSTSGRDQEIVGQEQLDVLTDTLGYTAIGRSAGQSDSGRVIRVEAFSNKPPRVEAEGWQTALPVITEPEAFTVITGIS